MQIILASAKIMNVSIKREQSKFVCSVEREKRGMKSNDRSATKGDACQSKKVKSSPVISLSSPRFQHEADSFAKDMAQYSADTIVEILAVWAKTCRGAMTRFIIENRIDKPEDLCTFSYEGFTYESKLGEPDFPHFIKQ